MMSQLPANVYNIPSQRQAKTAVSENPRMVEQRQVKSIVQQSLSQLTNIENRLDRLENQGFLGRVWGSITGSTQKEMIALMREITQAQQTTIRLVLTLAVYHAQNVAVMDEILDELDKAKGTHTRTASHIEFLYEQVAFIRDSQGMRKKPRKQYGRFILFAGIIAAILLFIFKY